MSDLFECRPLRASLSIDQCVANQLRAGRGSPCQDCALGREHMTQAGEGEVILAGNPLGAWAPGQCLICPRTGLKGRGLCVHHHNALARHGILTLEGTPCWVCRGRPAGGNGLCRTCGLMRPSAVHLGRVVQVDGADLVLDGARYHITEVRLSGTALLRAQWPGGLIVEAHGGLLVGEEKP